MRLIKKGWLRGIVLFSIFVLFALYQRWSGQTNDVNDTLIAAGMAFFLGLTSVIYEVRRWSFPKQIFIHWSVMHVTILPLVLLRTDSWVHAYIQFNKSGLLLFTVTFLLFKFIRRRQIKTS